MLIKLKGIVLHTVKFGENSLITTLYTDKSGRQSFILNSVRKKGEANKAGLLQPLFILEIEAYQKQTREIQRIKEIKNSYPYRNIPFDIVKSAQAIFLSEILYKTLQEEETNPHLFNFLENMLEVFDNLSEGKNNFHLCFLTRLTEYLGIMPDFNPKKPDGWFDMKRGEMVNREPPHPLFMNQEITRLFRQITYLEINELELLKFSKHQKETFLGQLLDYYHLHFDSLGNVRSLSVLKEVFN